MNENKNPQTIHSSEQNEENEFNLGLETYLEQNVETLLTIQKEVFGLSHLVDRLTLAIIIQILFSIGLIVSWLMFR